MCLYVCIFKSTLGKCGILINSSYLSYNVLGHLFLNAGISLRTSHLATVQSSTYPPPKAAYNLGSKLWLMKYPCSHSPLQLAAGRLQCPRNLYPTSIPPHQIPAATDSSRLPIVATCMPLAFFPSSHPGKLRPVVLCAKQLQSA